MAVERFATKRRVDIEGTGGGLVIVGTGSGEEAYM